MSNFVVLQNKQHIVLKCAQEIRKEAIACEHIVWQVKLCDLIWHVSSRSGEASR